MRLAVIIMAGVLATFAFEHRELSAALRQAQAKALNLRPAFNVIGQDLVRSTHGHFDAQGRPVPWQPLAPSTLASRAERGKSGKVLTVNSALRNSVTHKPGRDHVLVGTNVEYAAIHQFGGKTRPHVITPRGSRPGRDTRGRFKRKGTAKVLRFVVGGRAVFARYVFHPGSEVPARPFLVLLDSDQEQAAVTLLEYIADPIA